MTELFTVTGTGVVPGVAYAPAAWSWPRPVPRSEQRVVPDAERDAELERYRAAAETVAGRIAERAASAEGETAEVLAATADMVRDRGLERSVRRAVAGGSTAEAATIAATEEFVRQLLAANGVMAERATDLRDVRDRLLAELMGLPEPGLPHPDGPVVLLADDVAPADTADLDPAVFRAIVTRHGGPTSHTAIIARQLGIPCIVAATALEMVSDGVPVLVDGAGTVTVGLPADEAEARVAEDADRRAAVRDWSGPARTADGVAIEIFANAQNGAAAALAAASGDVQGVGLLRTELCFLHSRTEPTVEEQARLYGEVFAAFPQSKVVVRTLDAGADKPVPFAHHEPEENPALGVRGIRLRHTNPGLIERQLDAIGLAAAGRPAGTTRVMAPMVATIAEARWFAALCRDRALSPGIMIEVPAVALQADAFLAEVDFVSIGTNDLTQYTMAADRGASPLATLTDPWQPAVLRLIDLVGSAGARAGKSVGICGEGAADPLLACVLLGLGATSLSMTSTAIRAVGAQLASVTYEDCREASRAAMEAADEREARVAAHRILG